MFKLSAAIVGLVEDGAGGGDSVSQAVGKKRSAEASEGSVGRTGS